MRKGLARFLVSLVCVLVSMGICFSPAATAADEKPSEARPSEIMGTIIINGCTADPSQIAIQAVPMGVTSSDGRRFAPDPRAVSKFATFKKTSDPHLFRFSIMGLHPATLYRLGISHQPSPCNKIFWRGPMDGLAVSGGPPVEIEGFAVGTELEVLQAGTDEWVGMDNLQFTDPDGEAVRTLRWRSTIRDVVAGELQVSTRAFPTSGRFGPCDEPPTGIVYRQQLPAREGEWAEIGAVDFSQILRPARTAPSPTDDIPTEDAAISDTTYQQLLAGAPVYVRVVPVTAMGPACDTKSDGVHGWVVLAKLPSGFDVPPEPAPQPFVLEAWENQRYDGPYFAGLSTFSIPPSYGELGYKVTKKHTLPPDPKKWQGLGSYASYWSSKDPLGYTLVSIGYYNFGTTLYPAGPSFKGASFYFTPSSSGGGGGDPLSNFTSAIKGLVTAGFGFFGDAVSWATNIVEEVKNGVAEVVVDAINAGGLGGACDALSEVGTSCEKAIKTGMEYGLISIGMPPSLPNWNPDQGFDYLASEIASQIGDPTGFTEDQVRDLAKAAAKSAIDKMTEKRGSGAGPQYDWFIPYLGFEPAVWTLTVKKNDDDPLPSNLYIRTKASGLYRNAEVHVPSMFPSSNVLRIPVVLHPDVSGIPPPHCLTQFGKVTCTPLLFWSKPVCEQWVSGKFATYPCEATNFVGIYYRDAWVKQLKASGCILLQGVSYVTYIGGWLPYPAPPFMDFAHVEPEGAAFWHGPFYKSPFCS